MVCRRDAGTFSEGINSFSYSLEHSPFNYRSATQHDSLVRFVYSDTRQCLDSSLFQRQQWRPLLYFEAQLDLAYAPDVLSELPSLPPRLEGDCLVDDIWWKFQMQAMIGRRKQRRSEGAKKKAC